MRRSALYVISAFLLTILLGVLLYNSLKLSDFTEENDTNKSKVEISFMHYVYFPDEIFAKFNELYPNVTVDYQHYNLSSYNEILQKKILMGEKLDVFGIDSQDLLKYCAQNKLLDLSGEKFIANYKPKVRKEIQAITYNKDYAISYNAEYFGIWYNKILFDKYNLEIPETYEEFLKVCQILKQNDVNPIVLGARDTEDASYIYFLRIINFMMDENWQTDLKTGKIRFDTGELMDLFNDTQALVDNGYISPDAINLTYHQAFDYFKSAKSAMLIAPDRSLNMVKEDFQKVCDPGVFLIPYSDQEDAKTITNNLSVLIGINRETQNMKEAKLFLEFISRPEIAGLYGRSTMSYPTILQTDSSYLQYNELWEPIRDNENLSIYYIYITSDQKYQLEKSAKDFIAGLINAKDLADIFQEIFASKYTFQ